MGLLDLFKRKLPKDDFAAHVTRHVEALGQPMSATYDAADFSIAFTFDDRVATLHLENAYRDTLAAPPGDRGEAIARYVRAVVVPRRDESPEETRAALVPVIRDSALFAWGVLQARLAGFNARDSEVCARGFVGDLSIGLAVATGDAFRQVTHKALAKSGLGLDAAFDQAMANLRNRTDDAGMQSSSGIWTSTWNDGLDASRLLLTDMIRSLPVHGDPVAAIPTSDNLFVVGSLDDDGIAVIAAMAADLLESDSRPLCETLLVLRDGAWHPYDGTLPADTAARLSLAAYKRRDQKYAEQEALLEKIHEKEGVDMFVASYRAVQDTDTGEISSFGQWTRGVTTLLPRADYLRLYCDQRHEVIDVPWLDAAMALPALLVPEPGLSPARYRVSGFPDDATYEALKARATDVREVQP